MRSILGGCFVPPAVGIYFDVLISAAQVAVVA